MENSYLKLTERQKVKKALDDIAMVILQKKEKG